jgi:NarL family two-component system sensor histidine kinase YdfH
MNEIRSFLGVVRIAFARAGTPKVAGDRRFMRPFMWMMFPGLVCLYVLTLYYQPEVRQPVVLVLFTFFMVMHAFLHFLVMRTGDEFRWMTSYVIAQGVIAFAAARLGHNASLAYGLFYGLIGETVGILWKTTRGLFSLLFNLLLSALAFILVEGIDRLWLWVVTSLPFVALILLYVFVFRRSIDDTERYKKLLAELETAHRQLAEYAARVEDLTIADERQRMARELHDTLSQGLAGIILQLEAATAHLGQKHPDKVGAILGQAITHARSTLDEARRAIGDLRAEEPHDLDLAVREEVDRFTAITGIPCELDMRSLDDLPEPVREHAARSVAEGLSNVARHASAKHAAVKIGVSDGFLMLEIMDDGKGFNPENAIGRPGHYGLLGMRERARLAGGSMEIKSAVDKGTTLHLSLPVKGLP